MFYIENHIHKKLLELINGFSKVAGWEINTQISIKILCISKEQSENEISKIPFTIIPKQKNDKDGISRVILKKQSWNRHFRVTALHVLFSKLWTEPNHQYSKTLARTKKIFFEKTDKSKLLPNDHFTWPMNEVQL